MFIFSIKIVFCKEIDFFSKISPVEGAFYATVFTWLLTAFGASFVFLFKTMHRAFLDGMLGFTGGVMVAASFWSLLAPGIEMSPGEGFVKVIPAAFGFGLGALFIFGLDKMDVNGNTTLSIEELKKWLFDRVSDDNDIG